MSTKELRYAILCGVKTAKELSEWNELDWLLKSDWKPSTVTHYTNRKDKK